MAQTEIWIGVVELSYVPEDSPGKRKSAFTVVTTWARSSDEYAERCRKMVEGYGWVLLGVENVYPVSERSEYPEETEDMISRTRANQNFTIYGTFHSYPVM